MFETNKLLENFPLPFFVVEPVEIKSEDTSLSESTIFSWFDNCFVVVNAVEYVIDVGFLVINAGIVPFN